VCEFSAGGEVVKQRARAVDATGEISYACSTPVWGGAGCVEEGGCVRNATVAFVLGEVRVCEDSG